MTKSVTPFDPGPGSSGEPAAVRTRATRGGHCTGSAAEQPERSTTLTFYQFQDVRHFAALDGIRSLSILLVLAWHMPESWWRLSNGFAGVTVFFVLSGFLITTLCLREESRSGSVSLKAFYLRRTLRIFPLYYLVLLVYAVLLSTNLLAGRALFFGNLPAYLTYFGDLTHGGHFHHAWSLGVEEKFYLLWPAIAFVVLRARPTLRLGISLVLCAVCGLLSLSGIIDYGIGYYVPIFMGCALALMLNEKQWYDRCRSLVNPASGVAAALCLMGVHACQLTMPFGKVLYPVCVTIMLGVIVTSTGSINRLFSWSGWKLIAERSYAIYLIHALVLEGVVRVVGGPGSVGVPVAALRFGLTCALSFLAAGWLYRFIESPAISYGRALSSRIRGD